MADLMTQILASIYLGPPGVAIWRWSEDEQAVVWPDGGTIAFRRELEEVLARLAPQGLPSLSAVVLVLAACREGWEEAAGMAFDRLREAAASEPAPTPAVLERRLKALRHALEPVSALPPHLRQGPDAKAALVELVLEGAPRDLDPQESAAVLLTLREDHVSPASAFPATGLDDLLKDLEVVARGAAGLSAERLALRARTGLDVLPRAGAVELPDPERVRRLLAELLCDRELGGVARLAQDLLAAVHVPRRLSEREEQALGGVSDLANRGPPERLLLSELAHDDLTLAVRLALGEALYLRRESPPRQPSGLRALLIDTGIRLWGAPRLFAAAVALALAAEAAAGTRVRCWRPHRSGVQPVELFTREGLVEQLEALEPSPHPGPSLEALLHRLSQEDEPPAELLLVTHAAVLEDPGFQADLALLQGHGALGERPLLVATVDAEGRYRLQALGRRGRRPLGQATLSLRTLHPAPPQAPPLQAPTREVELPILLRQESIPLRLPHRLDPTRTAWHPRHGLLCATRDGRLTRWDRPGLGGRQLTDRVPDGRVVWIDLDDEGVSRCLIDAAARGTHLLQVGPHEQQVRRARPFRPAEQQLMGAVRIGGALALVLSRAVHLIEPDTGATIATLRLTPGTSWSRGRFFRSPLGWRALTWDGQGLQLHPILGQLEPPAVAVWERHGEDGLTALRADGVLEHRHPDRPLQQTAVRLGDTPWNCLGVSRDGRLVRIGRVGVPDDLVVAISGPPLQASLAAVKGEGELALAPELAEFAAGMPQLRRRFLCVGADEQAQLVVESRRGAAWPLVLDPATGGLRLGPSNPRLRLLARAPLQEHPGPSGVSFPVRVARFGDGSRVFLDGRGILHLQSPRLPVELALVLPDDGPAAVWCSSGQVCGPPWFLGDAREAAPPEELQRWLSAFAGGLS